MAGDSTGTGADGAGGDLSVRIVVPWRDKGDVHRRRNKDFVVMYLESLGLGEVVVSSDDKTGPFNRSAAYNNGTDDADVYIWHEADMIVPRAQLAEAVELAATSPGLVVPFFNYAYLSEHDSALVLDGEPAESFEPERTMGSGRAIGAVGVTSRETMLMVGQWDESFDGWGYDDRAMKIAFDTAAGPTRYVEGWGIHLWHTPGWQAGEKFAGGAEVPLEEREATARNKDRLRLYRDALTPAQVRSLTLGL